MARRFTLSCLIALLGFRVLEAQLANTTTLLGTVTDSSGAAVPGASITAVNTATNDTYRTTTSSQGTYTIEFVKVGSYKITAAQPGFSALTKSGITVDANQADRIDFTLAIGQVSESIVVNASNPPISTDEASVRETIGERAVADLPLNGRDPLQLVLTAPGVLPGQKPTNDVPPGEDFIGAGSRENQNSISLDGITIMKQSLFADALSPVRRCDSGV